MNCLYKIYQQHTIIRFLIIGGINTLFGYLVFSGCTLLGMHYSGAALASLLTGILFNFFTYGNLVFYNTAPILIFKFILAYGLIYSLNLFALSFLLSHQINAYVAQALLVIPLAICAYKLNKDFVFRTTKRLTA